MLINTDDPPSDGDTYFGQLVERYCHDFGIETDTELQQVLAKRGYAVHVSTIGNYKNGRRKIPIEFINEFSLALNLNRDQTYALLYAYIADFALHVFREYSIAQQNS